ncbi:MAG: AAA-like domain-containing protein [Cyanobacteria bacterium P01_D01_bin.44]
MKDVTLSFEVFISYSHRDDELRQQLDVHLASLERQGKVTAWHDRAVEAGQEWAYEIKKHLESAHVILLLISPDFLASKYCYDQEMRRAMERHEARTATVLPIILRPVYWNNTPFSKLQVLPKDGKAITRWNDQDEAFVNVIEGIDKSIENLSHSLQQKAFTNQLKVCQSRHNLPQPDYGKFIGREEEKGKIKEKLRPYPYSVHSVITIDGIGGIGKSALALEVSLSFLRNHEKLPPEERFEAIVWTSAKLTSLKADRGIVNREQAFQTLDDIYKTLAVVLQVENLFQLQKEERKELIHRELSQKRTLLIIDNLETVDDAAVMEFLQDSLPAPTKAIVTTRHRIDVAFPIRLRGMLWDEAELLIQQECEKKSVSLSSENQLDLYNRTGGVPLAIVWSIGQIGFGYPVNMVLKKLGNHSGDLTRFCFQAAVSNIRGKTAYNLLLSLALCNGHSNRDELGCIAGLEDDEWNRDDGLVELDKLSLINKDGDTFSLLPLTREYVNCELESAAKFVEIAILRLISYQASRDLELSRNYFEKYKNRLSNSTKIKALNTLGYGTQEVPQGQVPLGSPFYVERVPMELYCYQEIMRPGALIRINGPRQMGKSSLLARVVQYSSQQNYNTVSLDFQRFDNSLFADLNNFLKRLCSSIAEGLRLPNKRDEYWDDLCGSKDNFIVYLEEYILTQCKEPLVLALDEVDKIFKYPEIANNFLSLIRAIHEYSKSSSSPLWAKLRLVVVNSEEVYIPLDLNQSPFNVGLPVSLSEFTDVQVLDLSARHGLNLSNDQVQSLMEMCGGHPYLIRVALYIVAQGQMSLKEFLKIAPTEQGMYTDHLRRHLLNLEENPQLLIAMKQLVSTEQPTRINSMEAFKLSSMGLVKFQGNAVIPLCELYRVYFRERLA